MVPKSISVVVGKLFKTCGSRDYALNLVPHDSVGMAGLGCAGTGNPTHARRVNGQVELQTPCELGKSNSRPMLAPTPTMV